MLLSNIKNNLFDVGISYKLRVKKLVLSGLIHIKQNIIIKLSVINLCHVYPIIYLVWGLGRDTYVDLVG